MKELIKLVGLAKTRMDSSGISQVGRSFDSQDGVQRALMLLAGRSASIGNAVMILAQHQHANEALPLLRSLFELSLRMRYIVEKDSKVRAAELFAWLKQADWSSFWDSQRFGRWMDDFKVPPWAAERLKTLCADHIQANAQGLPWGHVFFDNYDRGFSSEEVLKLAALALGQALKALDARWPGSFEGAEKIWEEVK